MQMLHIKPVGSDLAERREERLQHLEPDWPCLLVGYLAEFLAQCHASFLTIVAKRNVNVVPRCLLRNFRTCLLG